MPMAQGLTSEGFIVEGNMEVEAPLFRTGENLISMTMPHVKLHGKQMRLLHLL